MGHDILMVVFGDSAKPKKVNDFQCEKQHFTDRPQSGFLRRLLRLMRLHQIKAARENV